MKVLHHVSGFVHCMGRKMRVLLGHLLWQSEFQLVHKTLEQELPPITWPYACQVPYEVEGMQQTGGLVHASISEIKNQELTCVGRAIHASLRASTLGH